MSDEREELMAKVGRLQQVWLAADEENRRTAEQYIVTGTHIPGQPIRTPDKTLNEAGIREMIEAWEQREAAFLAYREAFDRFASMGPHS